MNITMKPANFNQQYNKPAFKGTKASQSMVREAVNLMADVRCSYSDFEPSTLRRVMTNMKQKLQNILNHQNKTGEKIFGTSEVNAVNGKISSLQNTIDAKINLSA